MTHTGEWEISAVFRRLLDDPGELALLYATVDGYKCVSFKVPFTIISTTRNRQGWSLQRMIPARVRYEKCCNIGPMIYLLLYKKSGICGCDMEAPHSQILTCYFKTKSVDYAVNQTKVFSSNFFLPNQIIELTSQKSSLLSLL